MKVKDFLKYYDSEDELLFYVTKSDLEDTEMSEDDMDSYIYDLESVEGSY